MINNYFKCNNADLYYLMKFKQLTNISKLIEIIV